ncbi:MAG TPA: HAMP domain-containing sensor histidine kinase [Tepidisphaeraceae bacterium]|jgi:signal transduction histidine kinase|nr:HAMP domain-containing sensor histidine kinase [Tepidisphaeraceae bacterium]
MRRGLLWIIFGVCVTIGFGAMGWISLTVLRLDRQAQVEENVRLALWRMDSALSPLIAQETARPYFAYSPFIRTQRAYTKAFSEVEVMIPSPLLVQDSPLVRLHFDYGPDGTLTSPQVPLGNQCDIAVARNYTTREHIGDASSALEEMRKIVGAKELLAKLPPDTTPTAWPMPMPQVTANANEPPISQQAQRDFNEFQARAASNSSIQNYDYGTNRLAQRNVTANQVREGPLKPLWMNGELLLARRVNIDGKEHVQGCWLEWAAIRSTLLDNVRDLLPAANLLPSETDATDKQRRMLAAIPARLEPGAFPTQLTNFTSPIRITLLVAWICVALGSGAVALLLWGAISLSERRGAFVSAVTHELRTPLTTLSMYSEMLEQGMVPDEKRRQQYLTTLRAEANRLGHLVENVLAYSRIERGRADGRIQTIPIPELIDAVKERLGERAKQAGMELAIELPPEVQSMAIMADASAVEQILFNLVDNAGKYAASATDKRIHLAAQKNGSAAVIRLADHGPGISRKEARKLFRPFSKSAREAANSAPGVGLGLALCRRLARQMRGDLRLEESNGGASFVLTLPLADR